MGQMMRWQDIRPDALNVFRGHIATALQQPSLGGDGQVNRRARRRAEPMRCFMSSGISGVRVAETRTM